MRLDPHLSGKRRRKKKAVSITAKNAKMTTEFTKAKRNSTYYGRDQSPWEAEQERLSPLS